MKLSNLNEIKSTIIGLVLFIISAAFFAVNFKSLNTFQISDLYVPGTIGLVGMLLVLAPERLIDFLFGWMRKKTKSRTDQTKSK